MRTLLVRLLIPDFEWRETIRSMRHYIIEHSEKPQKRFINYIYDLEDDNIVGLFYFYKQAEGDVVLRVQQMKDEIKRVYGPVIKGHKVDLLPDNQVIAVYYSLKARGAFNQPTTMQKWKNQSKKDGQMTIFDVKEQS